MTVRHYDVIVLGRSLGALATAALLARRDFRVLLLGQGQRGQTYYFDQRSLWRRTFTLLGGSSPAFRRILQELAQSPQFRRHTLPLDPMFAWLGEGRRMEVPPDMELFTREVDREFPEVRQLVDELYANIAQVNAAADTAFERDAVWPPGSLWERFETGRAAALLPFVRGERQHDLLGKFPSGHPFRELSMVPALFATNLALGADQLSTFALARLHGAWTRGIHTLPGGEDELTDFLVERIKAHGGVCEFDKKASSIVVRRGMAVGVIEDGEEQMTGSGAVVSDQFGEAVADLAGGDGITKKAQQDWPRLTAEAGRFVVSVRIKREGLPATLAEEAFMLPAQKGRRDPRHPIVHVQRRELGGAAEGADQETLLVAEALLPARGSLTLLEAREAILSTLKENLPFLERHVVVVDSAHDGLPLFDYSLGTRREIERLHLRNAVPGPEPMERLWTVDPPGRFDFVGEPVRGPIPNTYLVGKTVLPGLGQEGELLAAWSAARLITKKDKARQRMRRQMWSKIETS